MKTTAGRILATTAGALVALFAGVALAAAPTNTLRKIEGGTWYTDAVNFDGSVVLGDASGDTLTINATATQAGPAAFSAGVDIGDSNTDVVTITSQIDSDLLFDSATDHSITIEASAAGTAGKNLTITAGAGTTTGDRAGGALVEAGGAGVNAGAGGAASQTGGAAPGAGAGGASTVVGGASSSGTGGGATITGGASATGAGGAVTITGGAATAGSANGGAISIQAGASAGGTVGTISLGGSAGSAVTISKSGVTTTVGGALTVTETVTANGDVDIGNASSDTLSITSQIDSSTVSFTAADHTLSVATDGSGAGHAFALVAGAAAGTSQTGGAASLTGGAGSSTNGVGGAVTIIGGAGPGSGAGGAAYVRGGDSASGTDGKVYIGDATSSAVDVSASGLVTTVKGQFNVDEAASFDANVTLGDASTDLIVTTGVVSGNVIFDNGAGRSIGIEAAAAATAGDSLTIYSGDGTTTGDRNGGDLIVRAGNAAGAGTDGKVTVGATNTSAVELAASTITTTSKGPLTVDEAFIAAGTSQIGNAASDTLDIQSVISSATVSFNASDHTLNVATDASSAGHALTIAAGAAAGTDQTGGALSLAGGAGSATNGAGGASTLAGGAGAGSGAGGALNLLGGNSASGTDGVVNVGTSNTSAVEIAVSSVATTVNGSFKVDEATTLDGAVTLGNATADDVTVTGLLASGLSFKKGSARTIAPETATAGGDNISLVGGAAGGADGTGGQALVTGGAGSATNGVGGAVAIAGGAGPGSGAGGAVNINGGDSSSGTDGAINIGTTTAGSIAIGQGGVTTTFAGTVTLPSPYVPLIKVWTDQVDAATDLDGATDTETEALSSFPTNAVILGAALELDTAFAGGVASGVTIKCGTSGDDDSLFGALSVFTGVSAGWVGPTVPAPASANLIGSFQTAFDPQCIFTVTGEQTGLLTAGVAQLHIFYVQPNLAN